MSRDLRDKLKFETIREIHPFANRGVLTIMGADERNRAINRFSDCTYLVAINYPTRLLRQKNAREF